MATIFNEFINDCICGIIVCDLITNAEHSFSTMDIRKKFNIEDITHVYVNEDEELEIIHKKKNYILMPV